MDAEFGDAEDEQTLLGVDDRPPSPSGAAAAGADAGDDALGVLASLAALSRQLAEDAAEEEVATTRAAALERGLGEDQAAAVEQ